MNIDCDLNKPYKNALDYLYERGGRKAVYEFFGERIREFMESLKGNPYFVKPLT